MAIKVYIENNYFYLEADDGSLYEGHAKDVLVTAVIAIATVIGTIVTTIYSPEINDFIGGEEVEYTEEMPPPPEYVEPEPSNNLPIWLVPLLTGGFVIGKRLYNNYKAKKE